MLNRDGIRQVAYASPRQILANVEMQVSVGCVVSDAAGVTIGSRKIVKAGTPVHGNLDARTTPFVAETTTDSGTAGVYTVQITTAFANGEKITIEGVSYEHAPSEDIAAKKFTGATAAAQVTSLLKMVKTSDFIVDVVSGATDKIGFTQKIGKTSGAPVVTKTATTGVIGAVATVTEGQTGVVSSNVTGILLHDVDVTDGDANATLLLFGFVNTDRLENSVREKITSAIKQALNAKITFIKY